MTTSIIHRGEIVERIIRKSGYSLSKLAAKLGISRNTLYNRFKYTSLSYQFILEVGDMIHYDFTLDFPEMQGSPELTSAKPLSGHVEDHAKALWRIEGKYNKLLEKHNKLLEMVMEAVQANELDDRQEEIAKMLEK